MRFNPLLNFTQVGRNLFPNPIGAQGQYVVNCPDLGNGRHAVPGYYTSVRASASGLTVQVKDKHGAFYKPIPCLEFLNECLGGRGGGGGGRGGRGGGGRGGGRGGYGGGGALANDPQFWNRDSVTKAERALKGLMVS